jgi:hypothetical protein
MSKDCFVRFPETVLAWQVNREEDLPEWLPLKDITGDYYIAWDNESPELHVSGAVNNLRGFNAYAFEGDWLVKENDGTVSIKTDDQFTFFYHKEKI